MKMRLGFATFPEWSSNPAAIEAAKNLYPGVTDPGILWHIDYMTKEPAAFWQSSFNHVATHPDQAADYIVQLKTVMAKMTPEQIATTLAQTNNLPIMNWVIAAIRPDLWEWLQAYQIQSNLEAYIQILLDMIKSHQFASESEKNKWRKKSWNLIKKYAPEDWPSLIKPVTFKSFATNFAPKDIQAAAAPGGAPGGKAAMVIGLGVAGIIGSVLLMNVLRRK